MLLAEDQILVSFEINLLSTTVSILWHNRILRDGDVISVAPHRGAYELIEGELPEHIRDHVNISIAQFTDEAILSFSKANGLLSARIAELEDLGRNDQQRIAQLENLLNQ